MALTTLRIESAIEQVADVEYTLTDTVSEALLLEANRGRTETFTVALLQLASLLVQQVQERFITG